MSTGASSSSVGGTSGSSLEALEGFALLCKSSSGLQVVMVLKQLLKHPSIFVFGELFDIPSIRQLEHTEHKPWFDLLKLFAYGTYMDYRAAAAALPDLTATEITKLKQLTIVKMAATQRHLPYSVLQSSLDIPTLRGLEDLVIECINLGLIEGHLNQKDEALEVTSAMGRDIGPDDVDAMIAQLGDWLASSEHVLATLQQQVAHVQAEEDAKRANALQEEEKRKLAVEEIKATKLAAGAVPVDGSSSKAKRQTKAGGLFSRR